MKRSTMKVSVAVGLLIGVASTAEAGFPTTPVTRCAADAVVAGTVCMDTYEASVWRVPNPTTTNASLVKKIQQGRRRGRPDGGRRDAARVRDGDDYAPCADNGQNCANDIYAVSHAGRCRRRTSRGSRQQEACANAGKRLPTSAEWQMAANGTPDPGRTTGRRTATPRATDATSPTGSRSASSRRAGPSTWWATGRVGGGLGAGLDERARAGAASATTTCASLGRARPRTFPVRWCTRRVSAPSGARLPARSRSITLRRRSTASSSAFAAPARRTARMSIRPRRSRGAASPGSLPTLGPIGGFHEWHTRHNEAMDILCKRAARARPTAPAHKQPR